MLWQLIDRVTSQYHNIVSKGNEKVNDKYMDAAGVIRTEH